MTAKHTLGVANIMASAARQKGLSESEIERYWFSGIIHDVGKLFIPRKLLFNLDIMKKRDLDFIRNHAMLGNIILKPLGLEMLRHGLYHHHRELISALVKTDEEKLLARTTSFADILETTYGGRIIISLNGTQRIYVEPQSLEEALGRIREKFPYLAEYGFENLDYSHLDQMILKTGTEMLGKVNFFADEFIRIQLERKFGYASTLMEALGLKNLKTGDQTSAIFRFRGISKEAYDLPQNVFQKDQSEMPVNLIDLLLKAFYQVSGGHNILIKSEGSFLRYFTKGENPWEHVRDIDFSIYIDEDDLNHMKNLQLMSDAVGFVKEALLSAGIGAYLEDAGGKKQVLHIQRQKRESIKIDFYLFIIL
jgi:hypothetical protein